MKKTFKKLWLFNIFFVCFSFFFILTISIADAIIVGPRTESVNMAPNSEAFIDYEKKITFDEVSAPGAQFFKPWKRDSFSLGYIDAVLWIKFSVQNSSENALELYLELPAYWVTEIDLYSPDYKGGYKKDVYGARYPFSQREIKTPNFFLPIHIPARTGGDFFVRVFSVEATTIATYLLSHEQMKHRSLTILLFIGFIMGGFTIMWLYNFFLFLSIKDPNYFNYIIYMAMVFLYVGGLYGFSFQFFWPDSPVLNMQMNSAIRSAASLGFFLFIHRFLNTSKNYPKVNRIIKIFSFFLVVSFVLSFTRFDPSVSEFTNIIGTFVAVLALYLGYKGTKDNIPGAVYFFASWILGTIGVFIASLTILGYLEFRLHSFTFLGVGVMLEMALLSFALGDRYNVIKRETARAQAMALVAEKRAAEVLLTAKRELEEKVNERTVDLVLAKQFAENMANTDELSGLNNRRAFFELGDALMKNTQRYNHTLSVVMLDIDKFKNINDTYGHAVGDKAIKEIAKVINTVVRDADVVGRLGGEEFALILPETDIKDATAFAERLREVVAEISIKTGEHKVNFTASFGVAQYERLQTLDSLIAMADMALYEAKHNGRNKVAVSSGNFKPFNQPDEMN